MFRQMDLKGQSQVDTKLKSTHQNTVNTIRAYDEANGQVQSFSSKYPLMIFCRASRLISNVQRAVLMVVLWFGPSKLDLSLIGTWK